LGAVIANFSETELVLELEWESNDRGDELFKERRVELE
jgi:hypothetical protein